MRDERFEVRVSFDERRGYVGTAPSLRSPVTALSLGGLRRRLPVSHDVPDARQRRSDHGEQTNDHYWRLRRVRRYV
jgi:hypothetical protein